jgi:iron complex transport system ATP-binding protein
VARFATRIALLRAGVLAAFGTPDDVMRGDLLESVYEWPLVVSRDPAVGAPVLVPLRHRAPR